MAGEHRVRLVPAQQFTRTLFDAGQRTQFIDARWPRLSFS
jgi:hypothetical protein